MITNLEKRKNVNFDNEVKIKAGRKPDKFPSMPEPLKECLRTFTAKVEAVKEVEGTIAQDAIDSIVTAAENFDDDILDVLVVWIEDVDTRARTRLLQKKKNFDADLVKIGALTKPQRDYLRNFLGIQSMEELQKNTEFLKAVLVGSEYIAETVEAASDETHTRTLIKNVLKERRESTNAATMQDAMNVSCYAPKDPSPLPKPPTALSIGLQAFFDWVK